jgi:hypothetical protein
MRNDMAETLPIADPPAELLAQLAQEKAAYEAALTPTAIDPRFGLSIIPHTPHTKTTPSPHHTHTHTHTHTTKKNRPCCRSKN